MKTKFYLTTPMYYVNDLPHLGHAYSTIAADAIARFERLRGKQVFLLTGTDEHGQKIANKAAEEGQEVKAFCDRISSDFRTSWDELGIRYDRFSRTTSDDHKRTVKWFFDRVYSKGDIYKASYSGWYCVSCERFYQEKELLEEKKCPDHKRPVQWMEEENYFFRLSNYQNALLRQIEENPGFIQPEVRKNEVLNIIREGLEDISISRASLKWGIPLPIDPNQVIYVWFDALISYLSGIEFDAQGELSRYWPAELHVVGKEIVRFHTIIWPAMLMSAELPLPGKVFGHGWLTVNGEKMSKTTGNVIKPLELAQELGIDGMRYYLLREIPFGKDGDYSKETAVTRLNADLANNLGNLLNRTLVMTEKYFDGKVPLVAPKALATDRELCDYFGGNRIPERVEELMEGMEIHAALAEMLNFVDRANKFIDSKAPWQLAKEGQAARLAEVMYSLLESLRLVTVMISPFIPKTAEKMWQQLGFAGSVETSSWADLAWGGLVPGQTLKRGEPIFLRIGEELAGAGKKKK